MYFYIFYFWFFICKIHINLLFLCKRIRDIHFFYEKDISPSHPCPRRSATPREPATPRLHPSVALASDVLDWWRRKVVVRGVVPLPVRFNRPQTRPRCRCTGATGIVRRRRRRDACAVRRDTQLRSSRGYHEQQGPHLIFTTLPLSPHRFGYAPLAATLCFAIFYLLVVK